MSDDGFKTSGKTDFGVDVEALNAPDLSPDDLAERASGILASAFETTKVFDVIERKHRFGEVQLMGRVSSGNEAFFAKGILKPILIMASEKGHELFTGKQFFIKAGTRDIRYAWVVALSSDDLQDAVRDICEVIEAVCPTATVDVKEVPLLGPGTPSGGDGVRGAKPVRA